jgi:hypothetical protein
MPRTFWVYAALAIAAPSARAGHYTGETDADKATDATVLAADRDLQWEGGVAFAIGSFHTGPVYNVAYGADFIGGARLDRLGLYAAYSLLGLGSSSTYIRPGAAAALTDDGSDLPMSSTQPSGMAQRLGLDVRYSLGRFIATTGGEALTGDIWVEAGLGEQFIRWNAGGTLHRADLAFGFGMQIGGRGPQHHGAYFFGVRATVAHSPPAYNSDISTCAGPCDTPTPPLGLDKSILFTTGIMFGS